MLDRYTTDALACHGRLRQPAPADARAELKHLNDRLLVEDSRRHRGTPTFDFRAGRPGRPWPETA